MSDINIILRESQLHRHEVEQENFKSSEEIQALKLKLRVAKEQSSKLLADLNNIKIL